MPKRHNNKMKKLMKMLYKRGIKTRFVSAAKSGSCYFEFVDTRMGKCRFGDHNERGRYGYRWQMRSDIDTAYTDKSKGHTRFFFPVDDLQAACDCMSRYYAAILRNSEQKSPN